MGYTTSTDTINLSLDDVERIMYNSNRDKESLLHELRIRQRNNNIIYLVIAIICSMLFCLFSTFMLIFTIFYVN